MYSRGNFNAPRRGVKQLAKDKSKTYTRIDSDIASNYYNEDDEEPTGRVLPQQNRYLSTQRRNFNAPANRSPPAFVDKKAEMVFKIKVPFGDIKYTTKWIIKQLNQKIDNIKIYLPTVTPRGDLEFIVRDEDTAEAIKAVSRRIIHRETGDRIDFFPRKVPAPWLRLKPEELKTIHEVIDSRFSASNRTLNLENFGADSAFKAKDMDMVLTKNNVILAVVDRIDEKYGNLEVLILSKNRIRYFDYLQSLPSVAKFLKCLDLSHNMITDFSELEKLSGLPLNALNLEGNPGCELISSQSSYISTVQKSFPRVSFLDGAEIQPLVSGLEEEPTLKMPFRAGFYVDDNLRSLIELFVINYFNFYDGENGAVTRKNLVNAYDADNSTFTLSIANLRDIVGVRYHDDECYSSYLRLSHNILREDKFARNRSQRVIKGAMEIAVALSKLPITNHYKESFIVDCFLVTKDLLGFTVHGLFEDGTKTSTVPKLQMFTRTFIVAARGPNSVAAISDSLFISAALPERIARYKALLDKGTSSGSATMADSFNNPAALSTTDAIDGLVLNEDQQKKEQMIAALCQFSGMVVAWSSKCLEDSNWDFEAARKIFIEYKDRIPREAFVVT
ncbi:unnamed protein product [Caenorhabditis auriculariae]|uniref:Uncharacterized protein n=1 Tax=Caenorhabditis auriculariae TaxID=2777116 RepID=A0A8S1HQC8_9PELO|nr:unnamed protein product [Caenorhabditis auriculariae]